MVIKYKMEKKKLKEILNKKLYIDLNIRNLVVLDFFILDFYLNNRCSKK